MRKQKRYYLTAVLGILCCLFFNMITVLAVPETEDRELLFSRGSITLYLEQEYQLNCYWSTGESADDLEFSSSNTRVARISSNGTVSAMRAGTAELTATAANGESARCVVYVKDDPSPERIVLETQNMQLKPGETEILYTKVIPDKLTIDQKVRYFSSDETVATVDDDGIITAEGEGIAIITAETDSSAIFKTCVVTVAAEETSPVPAVELRGTLLDAANQPITGTEIQLQGTDGIKTVYSNAEGKFILNHIQPGSYTFCVLKTGSLSEIAATGQLLVKETDTEFTAVVFEQSVQFSDGEIAVTEREGLQDIQISKTSLELDIDETYQMIYTTEPADMDLPEIQVVSSDSAVAESDAEGLIVAKSAGTATITFSTADGVFQKTCDVTVHQPESNQFSLWIILVELIAVIVIVVVFVIVYRRYIKKRAREEFSGKR